MKKRMVCTFNGTKSQARALVESIQREQAKKERKTKMERFFAKTRQAWQENEAFLQSYFGEAV